MVITFATREPPRVHNGKPLHRRWTTIGTLKRRPQSFPKMSSSNNVLTINIGAREPGEYLKDLHSALAEIKKLVFERQTLDLGEAESYALFMVTDFQQRLVN